jgi:hypothetical protein
MSKKEDYNLIRYDVHNLTLQVLCKLPLVARFVLKMLM